MTVARINPQGARPSLGDVSTAAHDDDDGIDIGRIITNPNWPDARSRSPFSLLRDLWSVVRRFFG